MDIEREIDLGQIEEVIEMAKDELELIDYYYGEFGTFSYQYCVDLTFGWYCCG